jgi:hypothetical protein
MNAALKTVVFCAQPANRGFMLVFLVCMARSASRTQVRTSSSNVRRPRSSANFGAACHACLLVPETSCEARNNFLDRALLGATVADTESGLAGGW